MIPFAKDKLLQSGRDILLETPTYAGVRSPNWLYAEHVTGEKELYNLARDRDELNSLQTNPEYDRMEANLAQRLARLRQCKGAVCRRGVQLSLGTRLQRSGSRLPRVAGLREGRGPVDATHREHGVLPGRAPAQAGSPGTVHGLRPEAVREAGRVSARGADDAERLAQADAHAPYRRLLLLSAPRHMRMAGCESPRTARRTSSSPSTSSSCRSTTRSRAARRSPSSRARSSLRSASTTTCRGWSTSRAAPGSRRLACSS